jgi:hypothetical protein
MYWTKRKHLLSTKAINNIRVYTDNMMTKRDNYPNSWTKFILSLKAIKLE